MGDKRDKRIGCTVRGKVYNKIAETILSRGSHVDVGSGFYNFIYNSDVHKIKQVEYDGWTRVEFTYYFHTF